MFGVGGENRLQPLYPKKLSGTFKSSVLQKSNTSSQKKQYIDNLETVSIPRATTDKQDPKINNFNVRDKIIIEGKSYEIVSHNGNNTGLLGQGAFGCTYKVRDNEGNEKALKIQRTRERGEFKLYEQLNAFKLQYQAAKNSSNVCSVESISILGNEGRQLSCILMPLVNGSKFNKNQMDMYTDEEKINFVKDLLNIYKTLTDNRVLHGDIKFENILIEKHEGKQKLKLIDFGCAKDLNSKIDDCFNEKVCGTPNYLPHMNPTRDPSLDRYAIFVMILEIFHLEKVKSVREDTKLKIPTNFDRFRYLTHFTIKCEKGLIDLLQEDEKASSTQGMERPLNKINEAVRDKLLQIISTAQIGSPEEFIELAKLFN